MKITKMVAGITIKSQLTVLIESVPILTSKTHLLSTVIITWPFQMLRDSKSNKNISQLVLQNAESAFSNFVELEFRSKFKSPTLLSMSKKNYRLSNLRRGLVGT